MSVCIPPEIARQLKDSLEKGEINGDTIAKMLPEERVALKSLLEDVVSEKLGIKVSSEEVAQIGKISKKIDSAQKASPLSAPTSCPPAIRLERASANPISMLDPMFKTGDFIEASIAALPTVPVAIRRTGEGFLLCK